MSYQDSIDLSASAVHEEKVPTTSDPISVQTDSNATTYVELAQNSPKSSPSKAHRITITSGKGGVGKSSFSCNLGLSLAKRGARVLLFDADLQLANLDLIFGIQPEWNLMNVVKGQKQLSEIMCDGPYGAKVVCGGSGITQLMSAGPKRLNIFYSQLEELESQFDYILFDTGAGVDNRMVSFCTKADEIILVTTPDPASITDSYAVVKITGVKAPDVPIGVVFNLVTGPKEGFGLYRILNETTTKFLNRPLAFVGAVRQDETLRASVRVRKPVVTAFPQAPSAIDIDAIAAEMHCRHLGVAA